MGCCSGRLRVERIFLQLPRGASLVFESFPVSRAIDVLSVLLLLFAGVAFALGVSSLDGREDLHALYWLGVGALLLKASVEMLRPSRGGRS